MQLNTNYIYILFYIAILNSPITSAQEYSNNIQNSYTIDIILSTKLITEQKGKIKELTSKYFFKPNSDSRQEVLSIEHFSKPEADSTNNTKSRFMWYDLHDEYLLGYRAKIKTNFYQYPIESTPFPTDNIPEDLKKYIEFDDIIENEVSINQFTTELINGENELFKVVFKIGDWINRNIEYKPNDDYNVKRASAVYKTKYGECDDFSVLFLSMLRSIQVPSRLVSGIAKGDGDFGYHAWVEVYFEGVGWVPFDATSGDFGYLSNFHIKLNHDSSIPKMILTQWEFYPYYGNVQVNSKKLPDVSAKIIELKPHETTPFQLDVHAFFNTIGINSYLPVVITSYNNSPYYTSNKIYIQEISGIEISGNLKYQLEYSPYEKKEIKIMLKLSNPKQKNTTYSSVLKVHDQFGRIDSATVNFAPLGKSVSLKKGSEILNSLSTGFLPNNQ